MARIDYASVTEAGGQKGSRAQLVRAYSRYRFASELSAGREVLEVACGVGQGLGLLARSGIRVVGLDVDETNLALARQTYRERPGIDLVHGDAQALPFPDASFDVVLMFEAIYYLPAPERFVAEAHRVLRAGGRLILCNANKDLPDFDAGAHTHRYFGPSEFAALLRQGGFDAQILGGSALPDDLRARAVRGAKALGARLRLIPRTMTGKRLLKRIFFGRLVDMPHEIQPGMTDYDAPVPIDPDRRSRNYVVIFATGTRA